jgi:hypothetical protein
LSKQSYNEFNMQTTTETKKAGWSPLKMIGWIILAVFLGLIAGGLGYYAWASGWLNFWHRLLPPPETAARIVGATLDSVDVETASGQIYRLDWTARSPQWVLADSPLNETDPGCERYANRALPLSKVVSRAYACKDYAEAGTTVVYALREDAQIYYWREYSSAYTALLFLIACPLGGAFLGLITGFVLILLRRVRSDPTH